MESLFNKVEGLQARNFIKKRLQHNCFLENNAKFLKTTILKSICERLLLTKTYRTKLRILQRKKVSRFVSSRPNTLNVFQSSLSPGNVLILPIAVFNPQSQRGTGRNKMKKKRKL